MMADHRKRGKDMKKGTAIIIKPTGHKATTMQAVYKNSTWVHVYDFDAHQDCAVRKEDIEKA